MWHLREFDVHLTARKWHNVIRYLILDVHDNEYLMRRLISDLLFGF